MNIFLVLACWTSVASVPREVSKPRTFVETISPKHSLALSINPKIESNKVYIIENISKNILIKVRRGDMVRIQGSDVQSMGEVDPISSFRYYATISVQFVPSYLPSPQSHPLLMVLCKLREVWCMYVVAFTMKY